MPANPKYLTSSIHQRVAKISAAILGGYILSTVTHLALASWFDKATILITATYSGFILWAILMIIAFIGKNGWITWGIYLLLSALCVGILYLGITLHSATVI
ncbi:hypothetical protein BFP72_04840 [Reichenbachiella sp. 5M10]|uniref:hypothetical protein n=1 Tax=Reichenbachiella sp. 5M10 TaxID=1889772 RepID=UPI000C15CD25|nr:hypothetical protein [Reichenbachiella sp. 5M10]PIB34777.1 hypothetical protein BFP72_04840 [Reichenbachiella sp. 5M10]